MKLHELYPAKGSKKSRQRVGRGISAGQGKTAGRGTKGQNARTGGGVPPYFEGGQLPLVRKLPFVRGHGFSNPYHLEFEPINIDELVWRFEAEAEVTPKSLVEVGMIKHEDDLIVVLGRGEIDIPLKIKTHRISDSARAKIEEAGGEVEMLPWKRGGHRTR